MGDVMSLRQSRFYGIYDHSVTNERRQEQAEPFAHYTWELKMNYRTACSLYLDYNPRLRCDRFYNEVTPEESTHGTYFMACGFEGGYFGLQETLNGKLFLFSAWDNDGPLVTLSQLGDGARNGRFANEGTGGQTFYDYDWQLGTTYRFLVSSNLKGTDIELTGHVYLPEQTRWQHVATFIRPNVCAHFEAQNSFLEDFCRDGESLNRNRRGSYGNTWLREPHGNWVEISSVTFNRVDDPNEDPNRIDAGTANGSFYLQNGGSTVQTTPARTALNRQPAGRVPTDLPT